MLFWCSAYLHRRERGGLFWRGVDEVGRCMASFASEWGKGIGEKGRGGERKLDNWIY